MIKFIVSSFLIYSLTIRILLVRVWHTLLDLKSRFFKEGSKDKMKMHMVDWRSVTLLFDEEGLIIANLCEMNVALMVK